jgi:hypothetical protein
MPLPIPLYSCSCSPSIPFSHTSSNMATEVLCATSLDNRRWDVLNLKRAYLVFIYNVAWRSYASPSTALRAQRFRVSISAFCQGTPASGGVFGSRVGGRRNQARHLTLLNSRSVCLDDARSFFPTHPSPFSEPWTFIISASTLLFTLSSLITQIFLFTKKKHAQMQNLQLDY